MLYNINRKGGDFMRAIKTKLRQKGQNYQTLRHFCREARLLKNDAIREIEKEYSKSRKYLTFYETRSILKGSTHYRQINSNMSQEILRHLDFDHQSFFALAGLKGQGQYDRPISPPRVRYDNIYSPLYINKSQIRINRSGKFCLPAPRGFYKNREKVWVAVPDHVDLLKLKQIQIVPKYNGQFFAVHFIVEDGLQIEGSSPINKALAIDLGLTNFATCVTSYGESFIIDGKRLKSHYSFFYKERRKISKLKSKQQLDHTTNRELKLCQKLDNISENFVKQACRYVINYCLEHKIDTVVIGYHNEFQQGVKLRRSTNRAFTSLPFGEFRKQLQHLCQRYGLNYVEQEESYTSKSSLFDRDPLPVFDGKKYQGTFSGRRICRGLYQTGDGTIINADVNGALNILRKTNLLELNVGLLQSKCRVDRPLRIRLI